MRKFYGVLLLISLLSSTIVDKVTQLVGWLLPEKEKRIENSLEFVHITKNAGTAIEKAGADANIAWGACHYVILAFCEGVKPDKAKEYSGGSPWHDPDNIKYAQHAKTFTVVRNPYERALSMYYYDTQLKEKVPMQIANRMSNLVQYFLHLEQHKNAIPQSRYVFNEKGEKIIDHVLRYETLGTDGKFEALMKTYNLNVTAPERVNVRREGSRISPENLNGLTIKIINDYFHDDFVNFNYSKLDANSMGSYSPEENRMENSLESVHTTENTGAAIEEAGVNANTKESRMDNRLEFVHITKNAGTAIEEAGANANIAWGACHYVIGSFCEGVKPDKAHQKYSGGSPWHDPENNKFIQHAKTFTVIRNPYERALSMYYDTHLNEKIPMLIANKRSNFLHYFENMKQHKNAIPQSRYVFNEKGEKIIDHLLRFETLGTDGKFEALMKEYNLDVTLPEHADYRREELKISPENLYGRVIKIINDFYHDDFTNFKYSKLDDDLPGRYSPEKENRVENSLEFVHITKNAGTAIEEAGANANIAWGTCHYLTRPFCEGVKPDKAKEYSGGSPWHDPANNNFPQHTKSFAVIRNPYERALSMYYYDTHIKEKIPIQNANRMINLVHYFENIKIRKNAIPQSKYVFNERGQKIIDHLLRFETLGTDGKFEALMKAYKLNVTLPGYANSRREEWISTENLNGPTASRAIKIINDYYHDDFINFKYEKLNEH